MSDSSAPANSDAREKLLAAAQALYAENGVAATTPRQVLQRSGIGQGSLYHHFPSKKDLAQAAVDLTVQELLESATHILVGGGEPSERIDAYLFRDRDAVAGCRVGRLASDPLVMSDAELTRLVAHYFSSLTETIAVVLKESGLPQDTARDRAATIVAVIQGGYVLARVSGDPERMHSAIRGLSHLLEGGRR